MFNLNNLVQQINKIQNKIADFDDSHEFKPVLSEINDSPVSPLGRVTFWIVVSLIIVIILWLILAKIDIVVSARGIVIPDGESKIIQPLDNGVISKILVKEGDFVHKGDVLMEIDPSATSPEIESIQKNLEDTLTEIKRLDASAYGNRFHTAEQNSENQKIQLDIYNSNITALQNQINIKNLELTQNNEELKSIAAEKSAKQSLLKSYSEKGKRLKNVIDIIALDDYEEIINQIKVLNADILKLDYKINELNLKSTQIKKEIANIKENFKSQNLEKLSDKTKTANNLKADADKIIFKNSKQIILSPCDGYIDKLFIHTEGGIVTSAQKLFSVTPVNTPLLIKAKVLNQDAGFIKEGMHSSIKIDTFDFQKYGMLEGTVKSISKNSITDEKLGQIYEMYIIPQTLVLKAKDEQYQITTGMNLTAEVKVGRRRVIEFFIYPLIKYLDEGMSVR